MKIENEHEAFVERIKQNVKEAENIINKDGSITMWIGNYFIILEPQFDNNELIYTTITIEEWYYGKVIQRFFLSTGKIVYENYTTSGYEKYDYEYDFGPNTEDPIYLIDEEALFNFLNNLSDEFDFLEEFKSFSGLA